MIARLRVIAVGTAIFSLVACVTNPPPDQIINNLCDQSLGRLFQSSEEVVDHVWVGMQQLGAGVTREEHRKYVTLSDSTRLTLVAMHELCLQHRSGLLPDSEYVRALVDTQRALNNFKFVFSNAPDTVESFFDETKLESIRIDVAQLSDLVREIGEDNSNDDQSNVDVVASGSSLTSELAQQEFESQLREALDDLNRLNSKVESDIAAERVIRSQGMLELSNTLNQVEQSLRQADIQLDQQVATLGDSDASLNQGLSMLGGDLDNAINELTEARAALNQLGQDLGTSRTAIQDLDGEISSVCEMATPWYLGFADFLGLSQNVCADTNEVQPEGQ